MPASWSSRRAILASPEALDRLILAIAAIEPKLAPVIDLAAYRLDNVACGVRLGRHPCLVEAGGLATCASPLSLYRDKGPLG